jgi:hypothetical protein
MLKLKDIRHKFQDKSWIMISNIKSFFLSKAIKKCLKNIANASKAIYFNSICKVIVLLFAKKNIEKKKYKVSLCLIYKDEAPFLKEWIDYHKMIGVDHFYLYNNNSSDNHREVIQTYIEESIVTLIDWPYPTAQMAAYKNCYKNYRNESNWICFLDADEFICLKKDNNIAEWLNKYTKFPSVTVYWKMFGTGGLLKHDFNKLVIEQYNVCWDHFNIHGKCFANTRYDIANFDKWFMHHSTYMYFKVGILKLKLPPINQFKYFCTLDTMWGHGKSKDLKSTIQINHYFTKAWDIYSAKRYKTDVFFEENPKLDYSYFYKYEMKNTNVDYTIYRFIMKLKISRGDLT